MVWRRSSLLLLILFTAQAAELRRYEAAEPHMGTLVRITLYAPGEAVATQAFRRAFDRIDQLNRILSDYDPNSELSRLRAGSPVAASRDLFAVVDAAQRIANATEGAYSITAGALTRLWRNRQVPDAATLATALAASDHRKLRLSGAKVELLHPGMQLDAGGIAKGYAAQQALRALGIKRALVAVSGDLAVGDPPPGRAGWRIAAQDRVLELRNVCVSTSGSTEQYFESGGKRYSHILDPRTGQPIDTVHSVTVVHKQGAFADALATAHTVTATRSEVVCYTPLKSGCDVVRSFRH